MFSCVTSIQAYKNRTNTLLFHASLLSHKRRLEQYRRAIFETVKPGDVVLDLGSGTGIFAFFACQAGARQVYAVEAGDSIEIAKLVCRKNGLQRRIVFLNELFWHVDLPERVDVIVTDTWGVCGIDGGLLGWITDARERFLKDRGVIIPQSVELFIVPVELPELYRKFDVWTSDLYGVDFSMMRSFAIRNFYRVRLDREELLGDPVSFTRLNLSTVTRSDVSCHVSVVANRNGLCHGLGGWFTSTLSPGVSFSTAPHTTPVEYVHAFFPLERPEPVKNGDSIRITMRSAGNGDVWKWNATRGSQSDSKETSPERKIRFGHSDVWWFPLSKEKVRKHSPRYAPTLSRKGEAELFVLKLFDGKKTISEIQGELLRRYPDTFHSEQGASAFVRDVITRCT